MVRQSHDHHEREQAKNSNGEVRHRVTGRVKQEEATGERSHRGAEIVRRREPTELLATITLKEVGHEGRRHWREDGGREAVEEAKREERSRRLYERVKERRTSEEETSKQHRSEERRVGKECRSRWSPYH